jgi:hypothetical protein
MDYERRTNCSDSAAEAPPTNLASTLSFLETAMISRPCRAWVAAAVFAVLSSAPSSASPVTLSFDKTTPASPVTVYVNGTSVTGTPGPYYWHESNPAPGSPYANPTTTFCVELTQHISTGNTYSYTPTTLASTPGVSASEATLISQLWGAHFNTAWESSTFTGSDQSTAFQLALWELVYDSGSNLSLSSGNFKVTSASQYAKNIAQSWLNGLSSLPANQFGTNFSDDQLVWLRNSSKQDQLTMIPGDHQPPPPAGVPAPPGVLLGLFGAACVGCRFFHRKRMN